MNASRCALALSLLLATPLFAGQPDFDEPIFKTRVQLAEQAIKDLGSDDYATRRSAFAKLLTLGRPAIEPLERAQQSEDPEVRLRAMELLISLRGRGFLGVSLAESEDLDGDGVPDGTDSGQACVRAMSIVSFQHPQYANLGLTKPLPAESSGMEAGDKLVAVNDRPVKGTKDLMREVISIGPARTAIITIERNGKLQRLPIILTRNPLLQYNGYRNAPDDLPPVDLEKELDEPKSTEPRAMQTRELEREHQAEARRSQSAEVIPPAGVKIMLRVGDAGAAEPPKAAPAK